jgi:hypothetical protein
MKNQNNLIKIELQLTKAEVETLFGISVGMMATLNQMEVDGPSVTKKIYNETSKNVNSKIYKETTEAIHKLINSPNFDYARDVFGEMIFNAAFVPFQVPEKRSKQEIEIELQEFAFLQIDEQAKFADETCRETCKNECFLKIQFSEISRILPKKSFLFFNKTSLANLALITLESPEPYRTKAQNIMLSFKKWLVE